MRYSQFLMFIALLAGAAQGTICSRSASASDSYQQASAVFTAEVVKVERFSKSATLKTTKTLKGKVPEEIKVYAGFSDDYVFTEGKRYLVFAEFVHDGKAKVGICSATKLISGADADLKRIAEMQRSRGNEETAPNK